MPHPLSWLSLSWFPVGLSVTSPSPSALAQKVHPYNTNDFDAVFLQENRGALHLHCPHCKPWQKLNDLFVYAIGNNTSIFTGTNWLEYRNDHCFSEMRVVWISRVYELLVCSSGHRAAEVHTHRQQASLDDDVLSLVRIWTGITLAALAEESDAGICSSIATVNPSLEGSQSQFTQSKDLGYL